ncbi:Zinc D-Ala-D-Ala carboxypeptidase [Lentibacillus sp. JNUCC-1]|uniref:D-alanyl-D-alanine carboxypeptidase family protein n=1 Tax=Lentibacillus sp. JNUCC-1 TaxID=2654513 RepID=UPI00132AD4E4|nr:D-alanyl-D-alanine carboxypeptidase family protein [Lentibacillus sp. JNUCC-1]MUV38374.1 Zinc D-Ala-D-Ala carboxypeptidase [Lentibacillus sp. JNUCC-1]
MKTYTRLTIMITFLLIAGTACAPADNNNQENINKNTNEQPTETADTNDKGEDNDMGEQEALVWPDAHLQKQDTGDAVSELQQSLIKLGYDMDASGTYDMATTNAITDIQLQLDPIMALGVYNAETREALTELDQETFAAKVTPGNKLPVHEAQPVSGSNERGTPVITNPYDQLALVNKSHALPADYTPIDLKVPDVRFPFEEDLPKKKMRIVAADALEDLFKAAEKAGHTLYAQSGYRAYDTQVRLFNNYAEKHGEEAANNFSARPGESEHQSGLTMDITSESVNFRLVTDFGKTPEGQWVKEHAADFGFIIRYPKGKEDITQYQYEPWHLRYVGKQAAQQLRESGQTLDQYLGEG